MEILFRKNKNWDLLVFKLENIKSLSNKVIEEEFKIKFNNQDVVYDIIDISFIFDGVSYVVSINFAIVN